MATQKWHADIEITLEIAQRAVQDQFPQLLPLTNIQCIGEGWDNKVFLVNETIIFRFPRRQVAVELINRETTLLNNLHGKIDIAIPHPTYIGNPTEYYPYAFHGYEKLSGISACHANLTEQQRINSLPKIIHFLSQIHSINAEEAYAIGAREQVFDRIDIPKTCTTLTERLSHVEELNSYSINFVQFKNEITAVQNLILPMDEKCLVHGDLYCRHLLFDHGELSAIIDWGDVGINNKAVDLAVIWGFFPQQYHAEFFKQYGEVDNATWQYARFLGLYGAIMLIAYGHDIGDHLLVAQALGSIRRINANLLSE